jgi:hypothetical protein
MANFLALPPINQHCDMDLDLLDGFGQMRIKPTVAFIRQAVLAVVKLQILDRSGNGNNSAKPMSSRLSSLRRFQRLTSDFLFIRLRPRKQALTKAAT